MEFESVVTVNGVRVQSETSRTVCGVTLTGINTYNMEQSYFKITLKQVNNVTVYMVRSDKVSEFFNNKIDYLSGDCSITVKGRFPTHKDSRKWFVISPTEKKYEKD